MPKEYFLYKIKTVYYTNICYIISDKTLKHVRLDFGSNPELTRVIVSHEDGFKSIEAIYHKTSPFLNKLNYVLLYCLYVYDEAEIEVPYFLNKRMFSVVISYLEILQNRDKKIIFKEVSYHGLNIEDSTKSVYPFLVMYSGGKDSTMISYLNSNVPESIRVMYAEFFGVTDRRRSDFVIEGSMFSLLRRALGDDRYYKEVLVEFAYPIFYNGQNILVGYEKEVWDNLILVQGFDMKAYYNSLSHAGKHVASPISHMDSLTILETLKKMKVDFAHCNSEDFMDFCYHCFKCDTLYLMGANKKLHGFDRKMYKEVTREEDGASVEASLLQHYSDKPALLEFLRKINTCKQLKF